VFSVPSVRQRDLEVVGHVTVNEIVEGAIVVHSGGVLTLKGVAKGGVTVLRGGLARIAGRTCGLFVAPGGDATVTGTCEGSVITNGGDLVITGAVVDISAEHAEHVSRRKVSARPDRARPVEVVTASN
jgi:hypothetical protein